jgi:hypothetical protein
LVAAHCEVGWVGYAYSTTVKASRVISQGRTPGTVLADGSRVGVVVSLGLLSRADAQHYMKAAAQKRFSRAPRQFKLTSCTRVNGLKWRCTAAWRDGFYRYVARYAYGSIRSTGITAST